MNIFGIIFPTQIAIFFVLFFRPFVCGLNRYGGAKCNDKSDNQEYDDQQNTFYFFAITQDCTLVFGSIDQLRGLGDLLQVNTGVDYCAPDSVQFHWTWFDTRGESPEGHKQLGLRLFLERSNRQICVLPIEFPEIGVLNGPKIFSYSIRSSLTYAACSYVLQSNTSFDLIPELSFADSKYSDVYYFVDPRTITSSFWKIQQLEIDRKGYFRSLGTFVIRSMVKTNQSFPTTSLTSPKLLFSLDPIRQKLFAIDKMGDAYSTSSFDLLFRPYKTDIKRQKILRILNNFSFINSFAVDQNVSIFTESFKTTKREQWPTTNVYLAKMGEELVSVKCVLQLPYPSKFDIISLQSLKRLKLRQMPTLESSRTPGIPHRSKEPLNFIRAETTRKLPPPMGSENPLRTATPAEPEGNQEENEQKENEKLESRSGVLRFVVCAPLIAIQGTFLVFLLLRI